MLNPRKYGKPPFVVAVIHGGPGAPGEMAPVARELSKKYGVLEPLQTRTTLKGQVQELKAILKRQAHVPVTLVGHSWGAMLSFIFAAQNPSLVKKLILVGSGSFEDRYAADILKTRLGRLNQKERQEVDTLFKILSNPTGKGKNRIFARLGKLLGQADSYKALPERRTALIKCEYGTFENVWNEAKELRRSGNLLSFGKRIKCPVVAIHGDYDPHPAAGVKEPLSRVLKSFTFILLKRCGHVPWNERFAKTGFYAVLGKFPAIVS